LLFISSVADRPAGSDNYPTASYLKRDVPATQVRPLAESSKLKAESGRDEPLSFELRASMRQKIRQCGTNCPWFMFRQSGGVSGRSLQERTTHERLTRNDLPLFPDLWTPNPATAGKPIRERLQKSLPDFWSRKGFSFGVSWSHAPQGPSRSKGWQRSTVTGLQV